MAILQVSNRTVTLDGRVYNLGQVISVCPGWGETKRPYRGKTLGWAVVCVVASVFVVNQDDLRGIGTVALLASACFLVFAVYRNTRPRKFWVLQLETAGRYSRVVASRDKNAILKAVADVCAALDSDRPFHSTVNISGNTIIKDAELEGVTINNTSSG